MNILANLRRVRRLVRKELTQILRDPKMIGLMFIMPVFQMFIFGYMATTDINHVQTVILDEDHSRASRGFVERLRGCGYFMVVGYLDSDAGCNQTLERWKSQIVIRLPRGFGEDLGRGRPSSIQTLIDGTDSMSAGIINSYVNGIVQEYGLEFGKKKFDRMRRAVGEIPSIDARPRVWFNPELRSVVFMVPGVLCLILFITSMIATAMSIVKEKELGTLEQIIVTPIRPWEFIVSKTIPFFCTGMCTMTLVLVIAICWFRVVPVGGLLLLVSLACIFLLTALGLGIFISTISETQQEAVITSFFCFFPMIMLSGLIFPIDNMPLPIQALTRIIPLRYFLEIVRGVYLKGLGFNMVWKQTLILILFGVGILAISTRRFSKRLD
ncbi:MAG: ABC transporter permease [Candidatus Riflebacteria bacterium]|nr:ABC transporter permease [Candidatus Riflebacteria bacterium]